MSNDARSTFTGGSSGISTRLGFSVDKSSVNEAKKTYSDIRKEIKQTEKEVNELRRDMASTGGGFGGRAGNLIGSLFGGSQGLSSAGQGIGSLVSNFSNLSSSATDVAGAIGSGGQGLTGALQGLGGAGGAMPIAAAATVALGLAMAEYNRQAESQRRQLELGIQSQREVGQRIARGELTTEGAREEIGTLNSLREEEAVRLANLEEAWRRANDQMGGTGDVVRLFDSRVQEMRDQINESRDYIEQYDQQIRALQNAVDEGRLSANDAEQAERALIEARDGASSSAKDAQRELDQIAKEQEASQKKVTDAMEEASKAADDAARNFHNASQDIATETARAGAQARENSRRQARDLQTEAQNTAGASVRAINDTILQAGIDFREQELTDRRAHERNIRDIYRDANRQQEDLLAERNFLAIDQLSKQTARNLEDVGISAEDEKQDRDTAQQQKLDDLRRGYEIERREQQIGLRQRLQQLKVSLRDELQDIRTAGRQKLEDARTALQRELEMARDALQRKLQLEGDYWQASTALVQRAGSGFGSVPSNTYNGGNTYNSSNSVSFSGVGMSQQQLLNTLRQVGLVNN